VPSNRASLGTASIVWSAVPPEQAVKSPDLRWFGARLVPDSLGYSGRDELAGAVVVDRCRDGGLGPSSAAQARQAPVVRR